MRLHIPCGDVKNQTIRVTDAYGIRKDPFNPARNVFHVGLDLRSYNVPHGPQGAIYAVESGEIIDLLAPDDEYPASHNARGRISGIPSGRAWTPYVLLRGDSGRFWNYLHVKPLCTKQRVEAGQQIAITDRNYGYSTAIHLHLEYWLTDERRSHTDPLPVLLAGGIRVVLPDEWAKLPTEKIR